ncbi:MAG: pimeloyl-ACP methyl ester carboxylesterase [Halioglobus sp.]|jgi:pimeloyl-ACP methyl ester carboxylesterase
MQHFNHYWYKSHDGLDLYAREYPCEGSRGQNEKTIVCIPGLTRNSADFAVLSQHLCTCFRVIAVDLRGRGRSAYDQNPSNYQPAVYAEDIASLLDSLGLAQVTLIGTSLGGLVSMILNSMQPERVSAVILNDIGPEPNQAGVERIKFYVGNRSTVDTWEQAIEQTRAVLSGEYPNFSDADWRWFTGNIYRENKSGKPVLDYDPAISLPIEQAAFDGVVHASLWPVFVAMKCIPTLLIRGELSDIVTQDDVARMRAVHPGMEYTQVDCCGHAPLLTEPESLLAIDRFLGSRAELLF